MCNKCPPVKSASAGNSGQLDRRAFIEGATFVGAAAGLAGMLPAQAGAKAAPMPSAKQVSAVGLAKADINKPFERFEFKRREPGPEDVLIDILYCGVCHTDIHFVDGSFGPLTSALVAGHEIVGRVRAIGSAVSRFKVGDIAGVGTMVDSCGICKYCLAGLEPYCTKGATATYGITPTGTIQGGYATNIVVKERFVLNIRQGVNLAATAPLLCAGITTYSPMQHLGGVRGKKVGVIGLGGLGHVAVKLAVDGGADVTAFSTSPQKGEAAAKLGASRFVVWPDADRFAALKNEFDYMIATVPGGFDLDPFLPMLAVDGTLSNVGTLGPIAKPFNNSLLLAGRRSITGNAVGGVAETQHLLDHCAERGIVADIELIGPDRIDEAFRRVGAKDVRFRFVLDMARFS